MSQILEVNQTLQADGKFGHGHERDIYFSNIGVNPTCAIVVETDVRQYF